MVKLVFMSCPESPMERTAGGAPPISLMHDAGVKGNTAESQAPGHIAFQVRARPTDREWLFWAERQRARSKLSLRFQGPGPALEQERLDGTGKIYPAADDPIDISSDAAVQTQAAVLVGIVVPDDFLGRFIAGTGSRADSRTVRARLARLFAFTSVWQAFSTCGTCFPCTQSGTRSCALQGRAPGRDGLGGQE
jgi:hypothetical protein